MDYRIDQLAIQANSQGAVLVEGSWYCPALPEPLITATAGLRAKTIVRDTYTAHIAARSPYQLKHKDGPDADGYQRLSCPALGAHPGLICPLRQTSLSPRDGRAKVLQPPHDPPRLCRQTAITIAPDIGARHRQDLPYGSPAWHKCYATLRNTIEGLNGYAKDPAHQALAQPPTPGPRHRRPIPVHRAAADGRQHPQDPRLASTDLRRQRQPYHPAGTPTAHQPPRPPTQRLTPSSSSAATKLISSPPSQERPAPVNSSTTRPFTPLNPATRAAAPHCQTPRRYSNKVTVTVCGTTPAVLSVTQGALGGIRTPNLLIRSQMLYPLSYERRSSVV